MTVLDKADEADVAAFLRANLTHPVSLEVWTRRESKLVRTDRDPCTHCDDTVELARQLASLHPGVSLTLYDLERHADRAEEAGIDRPPVTVIRGRGRAMRVTGLWAGLLLPAFVETLVFAAAGVTPLSDATREALSDLPEDVDLEVFAAPYDPFSAHLMRLVLALGVESRRVRAQAIELSEFPLLAASRAVTEIPVLLVNGQRFVGAWEEADLVEQMRRVVAGDEAPVIRERAHASPFLTEDEAKQAAEAQAREQSPASAAGLVLPGDA